MLYLFSGDKRVAEWYAPTREECKQLAPHIARIGPRVETMLHIPPWMHDLIVTSDDTVSLLMLTVSYLDRTGLLDRILPKIVRVIHRKDPQDHGVDIQQNGNTGPIEEFQVYGLGGQYQ